MEKKTFREYLKGYYPYTEKTLIEKENQIKKWKSLCHKDQRLEKLSTKEVLKLAGILKHHYASQTVNNYLKTLEQYYDYQIEIKKLKYRPLKDFRIRTDKKPLLKGLFTEGELHGMYETYPVKGHYGGQFDVYSHRNKVILGLIIYQGLGSASIRELSTADIDLEKALVRVAATSSHRLNERTLKLDSNQVMEIYKYMDRTRSELLKLIRTQEDTNKLFPFSENSKFSGITGSICHKLRETYPDISLCRLRNSRIAIWKKRYNLRETQYMAGYRSLLSLEKFNFDELEDLRQAIEKYHPDIGM